MELDIVHIATRGLYAVVNSLDTIFDDLFIPFGINDCIINSDFFQRDRLVGINQWFDVAKQKGLEALKRIKKAAN